MNQHRGPEARLLSVVLLVSLLLIACGKTVSQNIDDASVTVQVKTALLNDPFILFKDQTRIDVETAKGVVTLSGRVGTKEEETRAMEVARKVRGVTEVKSTLQILKSQER